MADRSLSPSASPSSTAARSRPSSRMSARAATGRCGGSRPRPSRRRGRSWPSTVPPARSGARSRLLPSRLGPLGTALTALGPAGLAAGAALAGVGLVLGKGLRGGSAGRPVLPPPRGGAARHRPRLGPHRPRSSVICRRYREEHAGDGRERRGRGRRARHLPLRRRRHLYPCAAPGAGPGGGVRPGSRDPRRPSSARRSRSRSRGSRPCAGSACLSPPRSAS